MLLVCGSRSWPTTAVWPHSPRCGSMAHTRRCTARPTHGCTSPVATCTSPLHSHAPSADLISRKAVRTWPCTGGVASAAAGASSAASNPSSSDSLLCTPTRAPPVVFDSLSRTALSAKQASETFHDTTAVPAASGAACLHPQSAMLDCMHGRHAWPSRMGGELHQPPPKRAPTCCCHRCHCCTRLTIPPPTAVLPAVLQRQHPLHAHASRHERRHRQRRNPASPRGERLAPRGAPCVHTRQRMFTIYPP